jgi:hypothetical protein
MRFFSIFLKKQIRSLVIDMNDKLTDETSIEYYSIIFDFILNLCERLTKFHFCPYNYRLKIWPVQFSSMNCKSAILSELKIEIDSFSECLYLFDGHFPSLSILIINVKQIKYTSRIRKNTVNII